jgi:D-alanine transaminase/branched-chain amino acid aminotransferase
MESSATAYVRGEFVPLDQARLHVSDLAIQRGYGVFDFLRVHEGQPLFLDLHLNRFYQSARLAELTVPLERPALTAVVRELLDRNQLAQSGLKLLLTGGYSPDGYTPPAQASLVITQQPVSLPTPAALARGLRVITHEYARELPGAKTINYVMGIRLLKEVQARGADDVLYHHGGLVSEFPRSNFFLVRPDGTVVTPATHVLPGITRHNLLALNGRPYRVVEAAVTLQDLREAREAFLTSTTMRVMPVVQIDDQPVGTGQPGPVGQALLQALLQLEKSGVLPA